MRTILTFLLVFAILTACGAVESKSPGASVSFYKPSGSVQCMGGGQSLQAMERQLADAGIPVLTSACGVDGKVYAAVCGAADGRIGIFVIPAARAQAATALGFAPLSSLPAATEVVCH
ncbi:hypothetical protein FGKAn22_20570 [Ferrigenium kumadai]|uniref:Lipoprotein n=1 Tax=Ferrigenium kumadai TaxID=1682490 RepID=A0AAN1T245_9PROT|nr:hypothetical protein [Ferrigenium kumadai]BBJ00365.1 hypothetical protein FGKAn22_20570 [Ferrigenium kumadai]